MRVNSESVAKEIDEIELPYEKCSNKEVESGEEL
jgi:hypothetical protein